MNYKQLQIQEVYRGLTKLADLQVVRKKINFPIWNEVAAVMGPKQNKGPKQNNSATIQGLVGGMLAAGLFSGSRANAAAAAPRNAAPPNRPNPTMQRVTNAMQQAMLNRAAMPTAQQVQYRSPYQAQVGQGLNGHNRARARQRARYQWTQSEGPNYNPAQQLQNRTHTGTNYGRYSFGRQDVYS